LPARDVRLGPPDATAAGKPAPGGGDGEDARG
jgi:hypothetical protein